MAIIIRFQDINGKYFKEILSQNGLLDRILPIGDSSFHLLGWVDPYSNTIFNSNQMYPLLSELDRLEKSLSGNEARDLLARIREIAAECRDKPQTYLRFRGD